MIREYFICAAIMVLGAITATAQQAQAPARPTVAGFKAPIVSPDFAKFRDRVLGTWKTSESFGKRASMPEGGSGEGTVTFTAGPGGMSVVENYSSKNPWGDFANHSVFWWDANANGMKSVGCETVDAECDVSEGVYKWEGDELVSRQEMQRKGPDKAMHQLKSEERYTFTADGFTYKRTVSVDGGTPMMFETVHHIRMANGEAK